MKGVTTNATCSKQCIAGEFQVVKINKKYKHEN